VTAYHLTNSGQSSALDENSPPLRIYYLPLEITGFLATLSTSGYRTAWNELVRRSWEQPRPAKKQKSQAEEPAQQTEPRRNYLYEDLFSLPGSASSFVRMYLLRIPKRTPAQEDPRRTYSLRNELALVSWRITELLLRKVVHMEPQRVDEIRTLGDRLAAYVKAQNDQQFFRRFFVEQRPDNFRTLLIRANLNHIRAGNDPLIRLDPYLTVFEEGDEMMRPDWRFARDLVLIRMIERLYEDGWIGRHPDALPEETGENVNISNGRE
jgi:CRISPR-associated protein Cst1